MRLTLLKKMGNNWQARFDVPGEVRPKRVLIPGDMTFEEAKEYLKIHAQEYSPNEPVVIDYQPFVADAIKKTNWKERFKYWLIYG